MTSLEKLLELCLKLEYHDSAFSVFTRLYNGFTRNTDVVKEFDHLKRQSSNDVGDLIDYWNLAVEYSHETLAKWEQQLSSLVEVQNSLGYLEWRIAFSERLAKYFEASLNYYLDRQDLKQACKLFDTLVCREVSKEILYKTSQKAYFPTQWKTLIEDKKREIVDSDWKLTNELRRHMTLRLKPEILSSKKLDINLIHKIPELYVQEWAERNFLWLEEHKRKIVEINTYEQEILLENSYKKAEPPDSIVSNQTDNATILLRYAYIEPTARLVVILSIGEKILFHDVRSFDLYAFNRLINSFYYCLDLTSALSQISITKGGEYDQNYKKMVVLLESKFRRICQTLGEILISKNLEKFISKYKSHYFAIASSYGVLNYIPWEALITPKLGRLGCVIKLARVGSEGVLNRLLLKYRQSNKVHSAAIFCDDRTLTEARSEAEEIAQILKDAKWDYKIFFNSRNEFSTANFIETLKSKAWGVVHFIGHGQFVPEAPSYSNIRLNDYEPMTMKELSNIAFAEGALFFLDACVGVRPSIRGSVLNACETAMTSQRKLETEGLWRGFIGGGYTHFIGCNWEIGDDVASHSAKLFYENTIKHKMPIADALLDIRQRLSKEPLNPDYRPQTTENSVYAFYGVPNATLV